MDFIAETVQSATVRDRVMAFTVSTSDTVVITHLHTTENGCLYLDLRIDSADVEAAVPRCYMRCAVLEVVGAAPGPGLGPSAPFTTEV